MSPRATREISVFIASPSDLASERLIFKESIDSLNKGFGEGANVRFIPLGWEDILATTGRRAQSVINNEVDRCDVFILALHRRWGQHAPDSEYSSYTEEEFNRALDRWKRTKSPEVLVFFKNVDSASLADPGQQLKRVSKFRKNLEKSGYILIRRFGTEGEFGKEVDLHLRQFAKGQWPTAKEGEAGIDLPADKILALSRSERNTTRRIKRAEEKEEARKPRLGAKGKVATPMAPDLRLVYAEQEALTFARSAVEAADAGRIQDASILFAKATEGTTNLSLLSLAAEFYRRIGDPENASRLVQRQSALAHDRTIAAQHLLMMLPKDFYSQLQHQLLTALLSSFSPEQADEIRLIYEEAFGGGRYEKLLLDLMVKHYSTEEIMAQARYLSSPEGQAAVQKQPLVMQEAMAMGQSEFLQVAEKRYSRPVRQLTDSPSNESSGAARLAESRKAKQKKIKSVEMRKALPQSAGS